MTQQLSAVPEKVETPNAPKTPPRTKNVRPFGLRDKIGYLLGDFGNDFSFMLVSGYLMVFYTDVFGISAAAVGTLFLIARFWDAVTDVIWGRFIDSRKTTPNGKFKPWIFRMSIPLVITTILLFTYIPGMSDGFYLAYAYVSYMLWAALYGTDRWLPSFPEIRHTAHPYPDGERWGQYRPIWSLESYFRSSSS